jgi:ribosomal protein S12 methylthiotransferase accessory factor
MATADELIDAKDNWFNPERLLPFGTSFDPTVEITWFLGEDALTRLPIWIPGDAVDLDGERSELKGICKSTNGLASGNTRDEALFHGLCELVERDATTLWSLAPLASASASCFAPETLGDPSVDRLAAEIARAGLRLRLFNQTSDLGVPVVMAVVGPEASAGASELEVAAGYGAHPVAARAAIRAITEAAQSRVTSIAASRDDIHSASFKSTATPSSQSLLDSMPLTDPPPDSTRARSLPNLIASILSSLAARNCRVIAVDLVATTLPFHVVKVLSGDLEDRDANINWRPGWRSFDVLSPR